METTSAQQFKAGDVVVCKQHPNKMTVREYDKENKVVCTWFDKENKIHEEAFSENELTH